MRFRPRRRETDDPIARLWRDLEWWFRSDHEGSHPGPDVLFSSLAPADLERAWQFVVTKADPLDPSDTVWDEEDNKDVSVVTALGDGPFAAATRYPHLLIGLSNIRVADEQLPWLGVFLFPDELRLYWWVKYDPEWQPPTVAALAILLTDLRSLLPDASVTIEGDDYQNFWAAIGAYVATLATPDDELE